MTSQPLGQPLLVLPREAVLGVLGELHVVGRVSIDEVLWGQTAHFVEVSAGELPLLKGSLVGGEPARISDSLIPTERNVELTTRVEPTEAVVTRTVKVVEELRSFLRSGLSLLDEFVKPSAVPVECFLVVIFLGEGQVQASPYPSIEVYQVWVDVVDPCLLRTQSQGDGQSSPERFHEPALGVVLPEGAEVRQEPTLTSGPLQGGWKLFTFTGFDHYSLPLPTRSNMCSPAGCISLLSELPLVCAGNEIF